MPWVAGIGSAIIAMGSQARATDAVRLPFGTLADGTAVEAVELANAHGMKVRILTLGATIQSLLVPDRHGHVDDVVLGYDDAATYLAKPRFFGATVGRFANRIAGGRFSLDGKVYQLPLNAGPNSQHGGLRGFDKVIWHIDSVASGSSAVARFSYVIDGEEGYPGTLHVSVTYRLSADDELTLQYQATTDKPTIVNLTNHSYFNLSGEAAAGTALDHVLTIHADAVPR